MRKGGRVVCGGIHMSDIPAFAYALLWQERQLVSVANLTRDDGRDFLRHAARMPFEVHAATYPLARANEALAAAILAGAARRLAADAIGCAKKLAAAKLPGWSAKSPAGMSPAWWSAGRPTAAGRPREPASSG